MDIEKPLVSKEYLLQKYPGKGGWTYAEIPEITPKSKTPFGWVRVKGSIDDYPINQYNLIPMGNGKLFLPVKAGIRKKIGKQHGDFVKVVLYIDDSPIEIPEEIIACFKNEPRKTYQNFINSSEGQQKAIIDWVYNAKTEDTKVNRIIKMMEKFSKKP